MNNLKKVLALVVAVAMFASFGFVASAADFDDVASNASYADAVNLLTNLGLIKGYEDGTFRPDNTITRAEVAAVMVRMLGKEDSVAQGATVFTDVAADNWASGYVNVAYANGIIAGMGDGTFAPNSEVTYEQVVKMIVCALGYEPATTNYGGYPAGYLYQASRIGLTKGVSGATGQAASRATVAKLVYNALEIELMDQIEFGVNGVWASTGETILTKYLELEKIDGVIISTYLSDPDYKADNNKVEVVVTKNYSNEEKPAYTEGAKASFIADNTDAATLLGYTVVAYVGENEDGNDEIFAVTEKAGKNAVTTIDTDLIVSIADGKVVYSKTKTSKNTTKASIDGFIKGYIGDDKEPIAINNVVVNGFVNPDYTVDKDALEEITFLDNDNDGDFEFIFVTEFDESNGMEFVVESVDVEDGYIEGKDGDGLALDFDDDDSIITIIKDGKIVDLADVAENDVVTVLDESKKVMTVYVSSTVVEGTVDEVYDDEFTIAGKSYKVSSNQTKVKAENIAAGDEGLYFINYNGKIAYVDTVNSIASADYVYVIATRVETNSFDPEYLVKVVTAEGAVKVLTIKNKNVSVYKDNETIEKAKAAEAYEKVDGYVGIAKIDTDAAGKLSAIYFPGAEDFDEIDDYKNDATDEDRQFSEKKLTYGKVGLKESTIVFNKDDSEENLEDAITATTVGNLFVDGSSYSFIAYGEDNFEEADVVVTTNASTAFDPEAPVMVVNRIVKVAADDDLTYKITGIVAGETASVVVDPDEVNSVVEAIEQGNVIIYSKDPSGFVKNIHVLLASNETGVNMSTLAGVDGKIETTSTKTNVNVAVGKVTDKNNRYFSIEGNDVGYLAAEAGANYTVVEYNTNSITVKTGSASAIKASETNPVYVFVKTVKDSEDEFTDVVIFKDIERVK